MQTNFSYCIFIRIFKRQCCKRRLEGYWAQN